MPTDKLGNFMTTLADRNQFNPVATWIQSKPWDGRSRLQDLYNTIRAVDEDTDPLVGRLKEILIRKWLLSAVAGAFRPNGVSAHGILVLQGAQYLGKTAWFKRLVPAHLDVIADGMILRLDDKDSIKQVISNWMVELGELDATFKRSDIAQMKAFITKDRDVLRQAYARKENSFVRRTVFFASVNPQEFLHDPTGNRRYWTIACEHINHDHSLDMQQIWAEILDLYKKGETWFLNVEEMNLLNEANREFEFKDPMEERIRLAFDWTSKDSLWTFKTVTEILDSMGITRPTASDLSKAGQIIKRFNGGKKLRTADSRKVAIPAKKDLSQVPRLFDSNQF
jgi:putative DNA primase/helicase